MLLLSAEDEPSTRLHLEEETEEVRFRLVPGTDGHRAMGELRPTR